MRQYLVESEFVTIPDPYRTQKGGWTLQNALGCIRQAGKTWLRRAVFHSTHVRSDALADHEWLFASSES